MFHYRSICGYNEAKLVGYVMSDHAAFIAAIADRPLDDVPRLVYADYLEENGDSARAEFIRVQCELARIADDNDPRHDELSDRESELLRVHRAEWTIPDLRGRQEFRRGFVEVVRTTAEWLVAFGPRLFDLAPVVHMRIQNADAHIDALAELPGLAQLETLDLTNNSFGMRDRIQRFFSVARLDRLRRLILRNNQIWPEAIQQLAAAPCTRQLTWLELSGNPISDEGAVMLAMNAAFTSLRKLIAKCDEVPYTESVHAAGAAAISASTTLTNLRELNLADHYIGDAGLAAIASSHNMTGLERLNVAYNDIGTIGDNGIEAVVDSRYLTALTLFTYSGNHLSRIAAQALAGWPRLQRMKRVNLVDCEFATGAREEIWASRWADRFWLGNEEVE